MTLMRYRPPAARAYPRRAVLSLPQPPPLALPSPLPLAVMPTCPAPKTAPSCNRCRHLPPSQFF